jgi:hypothetical protein
MAPPGTGSQPGIRGPARLAGGKRRFGGVTSRGRGNELRVREGNEGDPLMKWWKLALVVTLVGAAVLLLAGRDDIARYQRMRKM